jgi:hypothetical protein
MIEGEKERSLPPLLELHAMARRRAPQLAWPLARLLAILDDFPGLRWRMVAGRCFDYISERQGVRDGPRTLRTFMEREQRALDEQRQLAPPEPEPDLFVRCPICTRQFNITAELRRPDRDLVSVCADCFRQPEEDPDDHAGPQDPRPGKEGRQLRAV